MDLFTDDVTGAAVLIGVAAPYLIALVNQPQWTRKTRQTVAVVVSGLLGVGVAYKAGQFTDGWTVLTAWATVLATSQAVYGRLFAGSVRAVEQATSPGGPPAAGSPPGRHAAPEEHAA